VREDVLIFLWMACIDIIKGGRQREKKKPSTQSSFSQQSMDQMYLPFLAHHRLFIVVSSGGACFLYVCQSFAALRRKKVHTTEEKKTKSLRFLHT
jgi:hypothetical protein